MPLLLLSLFLTDPAPMDMPRAEAFLVREDGALRLEDRYDRLDLWITQAVLGRWADEEGRGFMLARLDVRPPLVGQEETLTRVAYAGERQPMPRVRTNHGFPAAFREAVSVLSPCPVADRPRSSRQLPHGFKEVCYWQAPENGQDVICTFRPEWTNLWYLAAWRLADGDDAAAQTRAFEDRFLRHEFRPLVASVAARSAAAVPKAPTERDLLRADARHSVAAYPGWRFTGAEEFAVLDDLPLREFVETLTNDFPKMRAKYAAALPTPLGGSDGLCVLRIYADRGEYLDALAAEGLTNLAWTAAYWCPARRELVACLSEGGEPELRRTIRHEGFHQYLSYATSMIPVSPWLNEGYAQYFEDETSEDWGLGARLSDEDLERLAEGIPAVLDMDYGAFYAGTDGERRAKYRLAWSIAVFIEQGADLVRLKPFDGLKRRYLRTLVETRDMRRATAAAFGNEDRLRLFVAEWTKFWQRR
ncbi:MAG: hypothetical protein ACI4RD_02425 [Kiritimatiellia bacterium]